MSSRPRLQVDVNAGVDRSQRFARGRFNSPKSKAGISRTGLRSGTRLTRSSAQEKKQTMKSPGRTRSTGISTTPARRVTTRSQARSTSTNVNKTRTTPARKAPRRTTSGRTRVNTRPNYNSPMRATKGSGRTRAPKSTQVADASSPIASAVQTRNRSKETKQPRRSPQRTTPQRSTAQRVPKKSTPPRRQQQRQEPEEEFDEFDPFLFIKYLPPIPPAYRGRRPVLPPKPSHRPPVTLVLDLDETLVHCSVQPIPNPQMTFSVAFNGISYEVYVRTRPHLNTFLRQVSEWFEVVLFTASQSVYADKLLDILDKNKYIEKRVFRESCVHVEGNFLKDLTILGRNLKTCAIIDNSIQAFSYQLDNGIPIESWFDDPNDRELLNLLPFLDVMRKASDVRPLIRDTFGIRAHIESLPG